MRSLVNTLLVIAVWVAVLMPTPIKALEVADQEKLRTAFAKENITREALATEIINVLGYKGIANDYKGSTLFKDVNSYNGEIHLVSELGIMNGVGNGCFSPKSIVTEEQKQVILTRLLEQLNQQTNWNHAFYAIASSSQMDLIKHYEAVSFGWAQVAYDSAEKVFSVDTESGPDFKVPKGFTKPMDVAKSNGVETYLMVYFNQTGTRAQELLTNEKSVDALIGQLVSVCKGLTKDGEVRSFDGLTIDFESFYTEDLKQPYNQFLVKLSKALKSNGKKLNVAVQPSNYFKGYDFKTIGEVADRVILMAHDYEPKVLTTFEQQVCEGMTPITPINAVYRDLKAFVDALAGIEDKSKAVLQISYGSAQWQLKNNQVIHTKPYHPSYDKINQRLMQPTTKSYYSSQYQNPYAVYEEQGIKNVIWYENAKSVQAKMDLAKLMGISNVSYWRLGTIPTY